jgi:hypothetical protein
MLRDHLTKLAISLRQRWPLLAVAVLVAASGCASTSPAATTEILLESSGIEVPPSLPYGDEPPHYERPEARIAWDLATQVALDGTPLVGFLIFERSRVDIDGWASEPGHLHVHTHRGTIRVLEVCREHNIAEAADVPRVPSVNIQPPGHLDRALRDAALGARVSNERTTEFALSLIWVPDDPASDTPIRLQRVDVRSRVRPGLDLYRDSVP